MTLTQWLEYLPVVEAIPYFLFCHLPSVLRILKTKSSRDVSLITWTTTTIVNFLYVFYGILIVKSWQFTFSFILGVVGTTMVLIVAIAYRKGNAWYNADELYELFASVDQTGGLTKHQLHKAINNSDHFAIVRRNKQLIGFARSIDDGKYSAVIDCLVVHADYHYLYKDIENKLIDILLDELKDVRYISVNPDTPAMAQLFINRGFTGVRTEVILQKEKVG